MADFSATYINPALSPPLGTGVAQGFAPFSRKMREAGLPQVVIDSFHHYYDQLLAGSTGYISSQDAGPVHHIHDYEELDGYELTGYNVLDKAVMIKLNGGLGTSMGMAGPKSLIEVIDGMTFLDIIVGQIMYIRQRMGKQVPLLLMNSFNTREETLASLAAYPELKSAIPYDFLQHKVPKILAQDLTPATWPQDPEKEWCPPGHGDIYTALMTSGVLDSLLAAGYEYGFISNADNLGATLDIKILGYLVEMEIPFLMEVAHRTPADRKGGHLAQLSEDRFILREIAQCPPQEMDQFQDIDLYRLFNTNNLWVHLPTIKRILEENKGVLGLPLILNRKPVDPTQPESPQVYQLETAMGSAISVIPHARALRVPRIRFLPVKRNSDLLVLWSDVYLRTHKFRLVMNPKRISGPPRRPPLVSLDDRYYQIFAEMRARFPFGPPSMVQCNSLTVEGDVLFEQDVVLIGDVHIVNSGAGQMVIPGGTTITGAYPGA